MLDHALCGMSTSTPLHSPVTVVADDPRQHYQLAEAASAMLILTVVLLGLLAATGDWETLFSGLTILPGVILVQRYYRKERRGRPPKRNL